MFLHMNRQAANAFTGYAMRHQIDSKHVYLFAVQGNRLR